MVVGDAALMLLFCMNIGDMLFCLGFIKVSVKSKILLSNVQLRYSESCVFVHSGTVHFLRKY